MGLMSKVIDGKEYKLFARPRSLGEAKDIASRLRTNKNNIFVKKFSVRIVKLNKGYGVYLR